MKLETGIVEEIQDRNVKINGGWFVVSRRAAAYLKNLKPGQAVEYLLHSDGETVNFIKLAGLMDLNKTSQGSEFQKEILNQLTRIADYLELMLKKDEPCVELGEDGYCE